MKFRRFAGLGGGFGGASDCGVHEFPNEEEATDYAWELSCNDYDGYDGLHGLESVHTILEDDPSLSLEDAEDMWRDSRESWLEYWVEPVEAPKSENMAQWVTS